MIVSNPSPSTHTKAGKFEYRMTAQMANDLLRARTNADRNMDPQKYLTMVVNETFGLLHNCERVIVE